MINIQSTLHGSEIKTSILESIGYFDLFTSSVSSWEKEIYISWTGTGTGR